MTRRLSPAMWLLAAAFAAALVLLAVELARGAAAEPPPKLANPCSTRTAESPNGLDATIQRVVLDGLDGAACRLHTTREELVLSLGGGPGAPKRRWSRHTIEVALRAGMLQALDEAERRGDVPGFVAPVLRRFVETLPLDRLVQGGIGLRDLL